MKFKRIHLLVSLVLLVVIFTSAIEVNALNTGFSTEELSEEKKTTFISNIDVLPLGAEPERKSILCFDVNEQGMIAIGQKDSQRKEICVYSSQGEFLYGYAFNCTQSFGVEWDEQHINVYFVRSDVIISLDLDGNILDIKSVQDTLDNNSYTNSLLYSTTRTVGDTTYLIRNDMGILNLIAVSYSQVVLIDANGEKRIIYDVNSQQLFKTLVILVAIIVFVCIAVIGVVREIEIAKLKHRKIVDG